MKPIVNYLYLKKVIIYALCFKIKILWAKRVNTTKNRFFCYSKMLHFHPIKARQARLNKLITNTITEQQIQLDATLHKVFQ